MGASHRSCPGTARKRNSSEDRFKKLFKTRESIEKNREAEGK